VPRYVWLFAIFTLPVAEVIGGTVSDAPGRRPFL
jgi:hypothetical protein